ncbi:Uncharacterized conserved protein YndB, AHSA1/START domain [Bryocella elongata]|uniref:Uncharacterized conserved protein YndB, AHSA1/START domain n=1 Tax=Bryocella elongata TaxID=863522 RepID=A0A1H5W0S8_9BACT|nr:SRPBCC domain-containing protein [Bryocella elongata]SEF93124.1 Uncharacterized conserved protein YndB, AHSA1/START domain [Bryocella elongata]
MAVIPSSQPASPFSSVKLTRILRSNRQQAWDAWTCPEIMMKWWGPRDRICIGAELDVRVGGIIRLTDDTPPHAIPFPNVPRSVTGCGVFTEVVPCERMQFTWVTAFRSNEESLITVTFRDVEGGTEITVFHEKLPSDIAPAYDGGWSDTLVKLVALYAA